MKLLKRLQESKEYWYLLYLSIFFFFLRLPSFFEPLWYGDEGIYQAVGTSMRAGRLLYVGTWDNKPPMLYIVYAILNGDQFSTKLASALVGIGCIIVFYFLAKALLQVKRNAFLLTLTFVVLFGLPLIEGNIANAENFMMLPILVAGYLIVTKSEKLTDKQLFSIGLLLSFAFLFKVVAAFDIAAFGLYLLFLQYKKLDKWKELVRYIIPYALGVLSLVVLCALFFLFNGAFWDFFNGSFRQMVGYVSYGNTFIIAQGLLLLKFILLASFIGFLFLKRENFSHPSLFILLWVAFSLFNAFFAGRPYTHYVLVLLPSFLLFTAIVVMNFSQPQRKTPHHLLWKGVLILLFILILKNFHFYNKTLSYYPNFISYVTHTKSEEAYQRFFDGNTPRDYQLASFLTLHLKPSDNLFVWGNNAQLYKLTGKIPPGRYTVEYHMNARKDTILETQEAVLRAQPKYIVVMPNSSTFPFSLSGYKERYSIEKAIIYESLF